MADAAPLKIEDRLILIEDHLTKLEKQIASLSVTQAILLRLRNVEAKVFPQLPTRRKRDARFNVRR